LPRYSEQPLTRPTESSNVMNRSKRAGSASVCSGIPKMKRPPHSTCKFFNNSWLPAVAQLPRSSKCRCALRPNFESIEQANEQVDRRKIHPGTNQLPGISFCRRINSADLASRQSLNGIAQPSRTASLLQPIGHTSPQTHSADGRGPRSRCR